MTQLSTGFFFFTYDSVWAEDLGTEHIGEDGIVMVQVDRQHSSLLHLKGDSVTVKMKLSPVQRCTGRLPTFYAPAALLLN
jgi:hypothetical protein